jgi:hypothetical protein
LRLSIILKVIIAFSISLSNCFAKNVYFIGEKGEFFQSLFRNDARVNHYLSKNLNEAENIIMLSPDMKEARKIISNKSLKDKKILFAFYYNRPKEFIPLPHMNLLPVTEYFDTIENEHVTNSPFAKPELTPKVKLSIQYEAWIGVFGHLKLSRKISELSEIVK